MKKVVMVICDANILIDFCIADKHIIKYVNKYLFSIYIPDIILAEVNNLEKSEAENLGCVIMETPLEVLDEATKILPGCSTQDTVCFIQAKKRGCACATNDKKLRKECREAGIKVYWGLEIILLLVMKGCLSRKVAAKAVHIIAENNRQFDIRLVEDFERKLLEIGGEKS